MATDGKDAGKDALDKLAPEKASSGGGSGDSLGLRGKGSGSGSAGKSTVGQAREIEKDLKRTEGRVKKAGKTAQDRAEKIQNKVDKKTSSGATP